jgi:hypothetical protein
MEDKVHPVEDLLHLLRDSLVVLGQMRVRNQSDAGYPGHHNSLTAYRLAWLAVH